ncbi:MAG: hypothetical protein ABGZ35_10885 [Planctomycetaceae bacterium]|jgi:hypothetical protein
MTVQCTVCQKECPIGDVTPARFVRPAVAALIVSDCPAWDIDSLVCQHDLSRFRSQYVQNVLTQEKGELTSLENEVVENLREHDILV